MCGAWLSPRQVERGLETGVGGGSSQPTGRIHVVQVQNLITYGWRLVQIEEGEEMGAFHVYVCKMVRTQCVPQVVQPRASIPCW